MRYELKRIEIWPAIRIIFIISLILGFFLGLFYAFLFSLIGKAAEPFAEFGTEFTDMGVAGSIAVIIVVMFFLTTVNLMVGALFIAIYNLLASAFGGFVVEWEARDHRNENQTQQSLG